MQSSTSKQALIIGAIIVAVIALVLLTSGRSAQTPPADGGTAVAPANMTPASSGAPKTATTRTAASPRPSMTKDGVYLIYYLKTGFSPVNLTIPLGKSVRFINESGKAMRIASVDTQNPILAAFNQPKTVGQGGIYEYTFVNAATFSYQNLNYTADKGSITVK